MLDSEITQAYINFATQDGTVHDLGANVLLYGPIVIVLLVLVMAYQFSALALTIAYRTVRGTARVARKVTGRTQPAAAPAYVAVVAAPAPAPVVSVPAQRAVAKVG